ncbi:MAG: HtpX-2 peptidase, heat shock protein HtpX [Candidatus Peregrinibacteria bacterium GW2011_GWE2_39_6]|nr:MAG: HtpX-2 peptidase, heat shock protein HtpX [Candidatus Peregrinibacteria bacterium GW2011_GWE2_39_6]
MTLAYTEITHNKIKSWLMLAFFVIFVMAMGFILSEAYNPGGGIPGLAIAGIIAIIWSLISYFAGNKIALTISGAKKVERRDNPTLYNVVENLSIASGVPAPKIYIIESPAMNAFATGRDPEHGAIAVTRGLLDRLEKAELEGVLAHELSHLGNYDTRLMMVVTALAGMVMIMTDLVWRIHFFGGGGSNNKNSDKARLVVLILAVILIIFGPLFATLIKLAISRRRESLADASAALLTRYPEGLAQALEKISGDSQTLTTASKRTAHLYICNPFKAGAWSKWFSTHPPIEERIKALRGMNFLDAAPKSVVI